MLELIQDYAPAYYLGSKVKGRSPYTRTFEDTETGKRVSEFQGLPMVQPTGSSVLSVIKSKTDGFFLPDNLFEVDVTKEGISLICPQDQPDGRKTGDKVTFKPQLYVDGGLVSPSKILPAVLDVDPFNSNYSGNCFVWDYEKIKRVIRIIEGKYLGMWLIPKSLGKSCRMKYNQSGQFRLHLGQFRLNEDEEFVPANPTGAPDFKFKDVEYYLVSDSATFYPDANPESVSVDGFVYVDGGEVGLDWATLIADPGDAANDSATAGIACLIRATTTSNKWWYCHRSIFLFDTSSLPDAASITSATLSFYGKSKSDPATAIAPDANVYSSAPASNTQLVAGDYDSLGSTAFSTAITYANWSTSGYNDYVLNASGLAAISKTGVSKFGTRNANYDVAQVAPTWSSNTEHRLDLYNSEQGNGYKPKLVVVYSLTIRNFGVIIG